MNWLDSLDPQKKRALEIMLMQQINPMQQGAGVDALLDPAMPMQSGQAGYGVLAPESNTPQAVAAAEGVPTMGQNFQAILPGLLSAAAKSQGSDTPIMPMPSPPPTRPVGTKKDGLGYGRGYNPVDRKRQRTR
jgi:hypothetical protein